MTPARRRQDLVFLPNANGIPQPRLKYNYWNKKQKDGLPIFTLARRRCGGVMRAFYPALRKKGSNGAGIADFGSTCTGGAFTSGVALDIVFPVAEEWLSGLRQRS